MTVHNERLPRTDMTILPDKIADMRVKHLEMVQAIVARIANHGAALKNWCITTTTAVCGFAITLQRPLVALLALLPIVTFALLDTPYLRVERRFRELFDRIRAEDWATPPGFEINLQGAPKVNYWGVFISWSIASFYALLAVGVVLVMFVLEVVHGRIN
jgi:hypothetical protein